MGRKIFSVLFALVLMVSFSLIPAVPAMADTSIRALATLYEIGNGTAEWVTDQVKFGDYAVKLDLPSGCGSTNNVEVRIPISGAPKLSDIAWSFWTITPTGMTSYGLPIEFYADIDADGVADKIIKGNILGGSVPVTDEWYEMAPDLWKNYGGAFYVWKEDGTGYDFFVGGDPWASAVARWGDATVTRVDLGYGPLGSGTHITAYVDDFVLTVDGDTTTYELEPSPTCYVSTIGSDNNLGTEEEPFATIQRGVNIVAESGTVHVAAGTYTGFDVATANIEVRGAKYNVDPAGATTRGGAGDVDESVITSAIKITADNVTVNGFKTGYPINVGYDHAHYVNISYNISENADGRWGAIHLHGKAGESYNQCDFAYIGYNTISGTTSSDWQGGGIWTVGNDNVIIEYNHILNSQYMGIFAANHVGDGNIIRYNTITNSGHTPIRFWGGSSVDISHNVVNGGGSDGIWVDEAADNSTVSYNQISNVTYAAVALRAGATGVNVHHNTITASGTGVEKHGDDITGITINYNDIYGNSTGFGGGCTAALDVRYNWWGHASGPGGEGSGSGDPVSTNVNYSPWFAFQADEYTDETTKTVTVNLTTAAANAGARWKIVDSNDNDNETGWFNSGTQVSIPDVEGVTYEIRYKPVSGYTTPNPVAIIEGATYAGEYAAATGSIKVVITPVNIRNETNAKWQIQGLDDSGTWRVSGTTKADVTIGNYVIVFEGNVISNGTYVKPDNMTAEVTASKTTVVHGLYTKEVTDTEPPVATLTNAPIGVTNKTDYSDIVVGGIDVTAYQYKVDDDSWGSEIPVGTSISLSGIDEDSHTLYVRGMDAAGNWQAEYDDATATCATWTVDITAPTATITNCPQEGATVGVTDIDVIVSSDAGDVKFYKYNLDDEGWSAAVAVGTHITASGLASEGHTLKVIGMDAAGNWQEVSTAAEQSWTIDTTVPTAVLSGLPATVTKETTATIIVGGDGVMAYKYKVDADLWSIEILVGTPITLSDIGEDSHTLYVNAKNIANTWQGGSEGETTDSATTYTWTVDTVSPSSVGISVAAGAPAASVAELSWTAPEDGLSKYEVRYSLAEIASEDNWSGATELFCNIQPGPSNSTETFTVKNLKKGTTYHFAARAIDAAGNNGVISSASITTTSNRPTITEFYLPDGASTEGDNSTARTLTVTGTHFLTGTANKVWFVSSRISFDVFSKNSDATTIYADVPAGAPEGTYNLKVINSNGTSALSDGTYVVSEAPKPVPQVTNVDPLIMKQGTDKDISITGSNFKNGDTIANAVKLVDSEGNQTELSTFTVNSAVSITATVQSTLAVGKYDIRVTLMGRTNTASAVKLEVYTPIDLADASVTGTTNTINGVTLPGDGTVPVEVTLETKEGQQTGYSSVEIKATIDPGTEVTTGEAAYTGTINPPRQVPVTSEVAAELGDNAVVFTMGSDTEQLDLSKPVLVILDITMPSTESAPTIYYLENDGSLTIAGVNGEKDGQTYVTGGTVLAVQEDMPDTGYTTYTVGVLLDHMSTLVGGTKLPSGGSGDVGGSSGVSSGSSGGGSGDNCFIATACYGTPMAEDVRTLRKFRDEYLLTNVAGRLFVKIYYRTSPPVADFIAKHPMLKDAVRVCLKPLVWLGRTME